MKHKIKESVKSALVGGILSLIVSAALNYFVIPMPLSHLDNTIGHGIGGFMCGFVSAFIGVLMFMNQRSGRNSGIRYIAREDNHGAAR